MRQLNKEHTSQRKVSIRKQSEKKSKKTELRK